MLIIKACDVTLQALRSVVQRFLHAIHGLSSPFSSTFADHFLPLLVLTFFQQTPCMQDFFAVICFFNVFILSSSSTAYKVLLPPFRHHAAKCVLSFHTSNSSSAFSLATFLLLPFLPLPFCHGLFPPSFPSLPMVHLSVQTLTLFQNSTFLRQFYCKQLAVRSPRFFDLLLLSHCPVIISISTGALVSAFLLLTVGTVATLSMMMFFSATRSSLRDTVVFLSCFPCCFILFHFVSLGKKKKLHTHTHDRLVSVLFFREFLFFLQVFLPAERSRDPQRVSSELNFGNFFRTLFADLALKYFFHLLSLSSHVFFFHFAFSSHCFCFFFRSFASHKWEHTLNFDETWDQTPVSVHPIREHKYSRGTQRTRHQLEVRTHPADTASTSFSSWERRRNVFVDSVLRLVFNVYACFLSFPCSHFVLFFAHGKTKSRTRTPGF